MSPRRATRSVAWSTRGMVATAQPLATIAGIDVLREGGTAADAAIAANACLAVVEPTACGLGGDLIVLMWDAASRSVRGLDASGRAPLAHAIERVRPDGDGTIPLRSPDSWTVPGVVDGWFELHARHGRLPMERLLEPAIAHASEGFAVTAVVASGWAAAAGILADLPGFAQVFMPAGRSPREGETFRNAALGETLRRIASTGREAFLGGFLAEALVAFSSESGGTFSLEDFERHRSTWEQPLSTTHAGVTAWQMPPPGQGLAVLQMLNMLEGADPASLDRDSPGYWHLLVEVKKLAYGDRARHYADPAFARVPVEGLLSKAYSRGRMRRFDPRRAALEDPPGEPDALRGSDTTYLCAADASGMMVSLIQSNYTGFGSGWTIPDLGFGLQNRGALFSLDPSHPNALAPGKRPFHTIIPGLATVGAEPWLAFGVMGGDMQPQGQVQVLMNLIHHGMDLQEAGDAARFHHAGSSEPTGTAMRGGGVLHLEPEVPEDIVEDLRQRGHVIEEARPAIFGGYQAVMRDPATGNLAGATERRKDGCALGW